MDIAVQQPVLLELNPLDDALYQQRIAHTKVEANRSVVFDHAGWDVFNDQNNLKLVTKKKENGNFHMVAKGTFESQHSLNSFNELLDGSNPFCWENFFEDHQLTIEFTGGKEGTYRYPMFHGTYDMTIIQQLEELNHRSNFYWETTSGEVVPLPNDMTVAYLPSCISVSGNKNGTFSEFMVEVEVRGCQSKRSQKKFSRLFCARVVSTQNQMHNSLDILHPEVKMLRDMMRPVIKSHSNFSHETGSVAPEEGVSDSYLKMIDEFCENLLDNLLIFEEVVPVLENKLKRKLEAYQEYGGEDEDNNDIKLKHPAIDDGYEDLELIAAEYLNSLNDNTSIITTTTTTTTSLGATITTTTTTITTTTTAEPTDCYSYLECVPLEILYHILLPLSFGEITSLLSVSKSMFNLIANSSFWIAKYNSCSYINRDGPLVYHREDLENAQSQLALRTRSRKSNILYYDGDVHRTLLTYDNLFPVVNNSQNQTTTTTTTTDNNTVNNNQEIVSLNILNQFKDSITNIPILLLKICTSTRWNNGEIIRRINLKGHQANNSIVSLDTFGGMAVSLQENSCVKVWNLFSSKSIYTFNPSEIDNNFISVEFDRSSKMLDFDLYTRVWMGKADGTVKLIDLIQDQLVIYAKPALLSDGFDFNNQYRHITWERDEIECYGLQTFTTAWRSYELSEIVTAKIINTSISPGFVITSHRDGSMFIRNLLDGRNKRIFNQVGGRVTCIKQIGDTLFVAGSSDNSIKIWDIRHLSEPLFSSNLQNARITCMSYVQRDGRLLVGAEDGSVIVWSLKRWNESNQVFEGYPAYLRIGSCTFVHRFNISNRSITSVVADEYGFITGDANGEVNRWSFI